MDRERASIIAIIDYLEAGTGRTDQKRFKDHLPSSAGAGTVIGTGLSMPLMVTCISPGASWLGAWCPSVEGATARVPGCIPSGARHSLPVLKRLYLSSKIAVMLLAIVPLLMPDDDVGSRLFLFPAPRGNKRGQNGSFVHHHDMISLP